MGTTEGDWCSAIRRAYYAVFHFFREFFLTHWLDLGRGALSHSSLYFGLNNCGIPTAVAFGTRVDVLRVRRVEADYDLSAPVNAGLASSAAQSSRQLVADFQTLLASVPPQDIVDGVRQHLRSISRIP